MKEELYVYDKNGIRRNVEINSPSGITLKWVSNIFNSLDKVNCSYSYTFSIPLTRHNREVFDYAEDVRHVSGLFGKKVKAEFLQNGVPLFKNAYLYVDKVTDKNYSCVFTWDNLDGLQNLKDNSCSLNELRTYLVKAGVADDELTDEGICDWYVNWLNQDDVLFSFSNKSKLLYPYYGSYPSDPNYSEYPDYTNVVTQGYPRPVIPVRYIIDCINKAFGTNFNFGQSKSGFDNLPTAPIGTWLADNENIISYGVLPLVGRDLTDKQKNTYKKELVYVGRATATNFSQILSLKGILGTYGALLFKKNNDYTLPFYAYKDSINYLIYEAYDSNGNNKSWDFPSSKTDLDKYAPSTVAEASDSKYACVGIVARYGCTIKMEGSFYIELSWFTKLTQDIYDKLKFHVYSWKTVNQGWSDEGIEKVEVSSFTATKMERVVGSDGAVRARLYFNFNESEGYEAATFCCDDSALDGTEAQEYWFGLGEGLFDIKDMVMQTNLTFTPQTDDMDESAHKIDSYTNLPDIDCVTFIKSLFYMVGGFPYISSSGDIQIKKYSELKENLSKGFVYDWSNRVLGQQSGREELEYSMSDFKRNNYYLNKWDDLDRTPEELEDEEDVYEDGIGNIKCENEILDDEQTVHQTPFYSPYVLDRTNPGTTDHTVKGVKFSPSDNNLSVNDKGEIVNSNKPKYTELKPVYGYVHRIPFFDKTKENRIKSWEENYGVNYVRMSVLNPFKNIMMNPSYRYLQSIVKNALVVTENLRLNEFDLFNLDYTRPIYLEKYNSYFAVITIQRNSKGICKCELIKLPAYVPPVKVTVSIESQLAKFIHYTCTSSVTEDREISISFILENDTDGQYVMHSKVNLKGTSWQEFNPTSSMEWKISKVWLDHYGEDDYNDYEFTIG